MVGVELSRMVTVKGVFYVVIFYKAPFKCFGFEWKTCDESPLDILDQSTCPIIEEPVKINSEPIRIELDDSLIKSFNELSDDELELAFGSFRPVQSLNPYMTKLDLCSVKQVWLEKISAIDNLTVSTDNTQRLNITSQI